MSKVTIVSALYNIGRERWLKSGFGIGNDRYKGWVKNLLSLDAHIYFFVDDFYYDYVVEHRRKYDPNFEKTQIVRTPVDEFYFYKNYYNAEASLMFSPEFRKKIWFKDSADMCYPLYHIINFTKIDFVKRVSEINPYNSDYFFWVDAGGMRENFDQYENVKWPNENSEYFNDKIIHFSHNAVFDIYPNKEQYFLSQTRNIQGTAWIVPKNKVNYFFDLIDDQVSTIIGEKIVGSDEKVYDFLHNTNTQHYQLVVCGWFKFFDMMKSSNQNRITVNIEPNPFPVFNTGKKVFIDMGAHEQQGLSQFKSILNLDPSWDIHCFEPNTLLGSNNRHTDLNVTMHNKAIWTHNGEISLNLYGYDRKSQGSIVVGSAGSEELIDLYDIIKTPCVDTYEFLKTFNEGDEIYIKMDIEWSEYDVLEYLLDKGWLKNIKKIWVEWHGTHLPYIESRRNKIIERLRNYNTEVENWH